MKKKTNYFNFISFIVVVTLVFMMCIASACGIYVTKNAFAEENTYQNITESESEEEITPRGLYTALSLSINGGNGKIWGTVKNDFTLFPSIVQVYVELYSSVTYTDSHENMELVSINYIGDLDQGKTIVAEAYTNGIQKYWQARMRYKIDNKTWESKNTTTLLYDADGNYLSHT